MILPVIQGCQTIQLTKGYNCLIDVNTVFIVREKKWSAKDGGSGQFYAQTNIESPNSKSGRTVIQMQRFLLKITGKQISDHKNGDTLDNRMENLRICNASENEFNSRKKKGFSKFKGVCWNKSKNRWESNICINGKRKTLGRFHSEEEAAKAYDRAAGQHQGEFARLNFPGKGQWSAIGDHRQGEANPSPTLDSEQAPCEPNDNIGCSGNSLNRET